MNKMKRYCLPSMVPALIISLIIVAFGAGIVCVIFFGDEDNSSLPAKLFGIVFCLGLLAFSIGVFKGLYGKYFDMFKKRYDYFALMGLSGQLMQDFERGVRWFNNKLIVGEQFMFGHKNGMIVMYNEINMLYRHEHRTDYTSGGRPTFSYDIKINANGKEYVLCSLPKELVISGDWVQFCSFLSLKNPNILVSRIIQQTRSVVDDTGGDD